jgi:predicted nucleic acid-binding protein
MALIKPDYGFWRFCTFYDSITMGLVQNYRGIDKGEAECYAQYMKTNANFIISDDIEFTNAVSSLNKYVIIYNTLHILSWLQLVGFMPDWEQRVTQLRKIRPFTSQKLRMAYIEVAEKLGLEISKKQVSKMCSLSKIYNPSR